MATLNSLSHQQRAVLFWVARWMVHIEAAGTDTARARLPVWGVPWHTGRNLSPARRASMSRAVQRLEARGLVLRTNPTSGLLRRTRADLAPRRATHLRLTPAGCALVNALLTARRPG